MADIRIGISGWRYEPWRGVFYPEKLRQADELNYASRAVGSIEINGSFYSLQRPESWANWYEDTPEDFVFSVKAPRYITHIRRLKDIEKPLANFFASGVLRLQQKLGPVLWQFPPTFRFDPERFEAFLRQLPHDTEQALHLARKREARMEGREHLAIDEARPLRHAVEIRHESFEDRAFVDLLRDYHVALVVADTAGKWPLKEDVTSDFVYLRLHGEEELYASGYTDAALKDWARRMKAWSEGTQVDDARLIVERKPPSRKHRDLYCYFDNDMKVKAPFDAGKLARHLGLDGAPASLADRAAEADRIIAARGGPRRNPSKPRKQKPTPDA
ncbi:DUF72 domain-containing protein [Pseudomonas mangiferae]|uniref:DUF72 domain-containing protein n=1 Tax=Pseudomonas mangiferae TaxID=2593654 RepID=A0A553H127_9PSED|nr:DUF72 domain-containing protein [Pseudomonas mangiferae]